MTTQLAFGLMDTSPVMRPTSENSSANSRYFWLLSACAVQTRSQRGQSHMQGCKSGG